MIRSAGSSTSGEANVQAEGSIVNSGANNSSWIASSMKLLRFNSTSKKKVEEGRDPVVENAVVSAQLTPKEECIIASHCRCCGAIVKYPESVQKFKCFTCLTTTITFMDQTAIDDEDPPFLISSSSIKDQIRLCKRAAAENEDQNPHVIFKPLERYLTTAFGSFSILNNSFKLFEKKKLSRKSPNIDYDDLQEAFNLIKSLPTRRPLMRLLVSASELLSKPAHTLSDASQLRWLFILWEIPTLPRCLHHNKKPVSHLDTPEIKKLSYDIIKRVIGYLSNTNEQVSMKYIGYWIVSYSLSAFSSKVELLNLYITFHLARLVQKYQNDKSNGRPTSSIGSPTSPGYSEYNDSVKLNGSRSVSSPSALGPNASRDNSIRSSVGAGSVFMSLPVTIQEGFRSWGERSLSTFQKEDDKPINVKLKVNHYNNEWHIRTAAKLLAFFFSYNKNRLPVYAFYNSLVDYVNVKQDFETWQNLFRHSASMKPNDPNRIISDLVGITNGNNPLLTFCQFPFLLSLGAKISILEHEAKRTMERKAEEAFINALDKKKVMDVHMRIRVRRTHISNDSLRCIKDHQGDLKKALKVEFIGEPGIDVGGLKKEWFSLLTKELFSPKNGMFFYSEESHLCWFAHMPLERNDELYYMVGAVLGLAIYNSTILDLRFPLALYKKLLNREVGIEDYMELFPQTAQGLIRLLEYDGDVSKMEIYFETTYKDLLGGTVTQDLKRNGSKIKVTNENRYDYVTRWIDFYLNKSIKKQFASFYRGFHNVIGGNALSLFQPKEIEMIICGDNETKIDTESFRSITKYNGWRTTEEAINSCIVQWFWKWFAQLSYLEQKKFLQFVTGSDRVPATGVHTMQFKITRMPYYDTTNSSNGSMKLPVAHTCFNELCIYEYRTQEETFSKLYWAINESSGFGLR